MEKIEFISIKNWRVAFDPSAFPVSSFAKIIADETGNNSLSYSFAYNAGHIVPYIRTDYLDEIILNWSKSNTNKEITKCGSIHYLAENDLTVCAFIKADQWYRVDCTTYDGDLHGLSCSCCKEGICEHSLLMAYTLRNLRKEREFWYKYGSFVAIDHNYFQHTLLCMQKK